MEIIRTTICRYFGDMIRADRGYDFAVLGASRDSLVFWAARLSHYGLKDDNPIVNYMIEHTPDALTRKIESVLAARQPVSGLQALDLLVSDNMSSIQFAPIQELLQEKSLDQAVLDRFQLEVMPRILEHSASATPAAHTNPRWTESAQLDASFKRLSAGRRETAPLCTI